MPDVPGATPLDQTRLNGLYEFSGRYAARTLTNDPTLAGCSRLIRKVELVADESIAKVRAEETMQVACRKGCWHCCAQVVSVSALEVLHLAGYIRETFSAEQIESLLQRLNDYVEENRGILGMARSKLIRTACPLLVDQSCSVFEVRPLVCRGYNSGDVSVCIRYREEPRYVPDGPQSKMQMELTFSLRHGVNDAAKQYGLDSTYLELALALRIALTEDNVAQRYLNGEPVFLAATMGDLQR